MGALSEQPRLYAELAPWFHLLTTPEDYAEEAALYRALILEAVPDAETVLELGSGGGNNASHLKARFRLTLTDVSPKMLELSRSLNPECEHVLGDMRSLQLEREFDAVFVHDAVAYITNEDDLARVAATAYVHCRGGGAALFVPDFVSERFRPGTEHGGHDGDGRALRYLQWTRDPVPGETTYVTDFAYLLREGEDVRIVQDRHVCGLFPRDTWLGILADAGFRAEIRSADAVEHEGGEVFVARRN